MSNTTPAVPADLKGDILMVLSVKTQLIFAFDSRCSMTHELVVEEFWVEVRTPTLRKREPRTCRPAYPAESLKVVALNVVWFQARC